MTAQNGEGVYGDGAGVVTPLAHKLSQNGPLVKDSTGKPRSGVFYAGNASLVTGKANMSYDVAAFEAAICRGRTKGTSYPTNDAVKNVATTAAPGSNSRIDIIYAQQQEVSEGDAATQFVIGVVQGPFSLPLTPPALPDGAIELARAEVAAGITATTSATITQTAPFTAPLGSAIPFRNSTERDAAGPFVTGQRAWLLDTGVEYRYTGSGWLPAVPVFCSLNKTGGQVLTTAGTDYAIAWDNEIADPWGMHDNSVNNTRITVPVAGIYRIRYFVYQNISSGYTSAYARVNGSAVVQGSLDRRNAAPSVGGLAIQTVDVQLTAGDYVEIMTSHSATNGVALVGSTSSSGSVQVSVDLLMGL